jgi:hypothetical protein
MIMRITDEIVNNKLIDTRSLALIKGEAYDVLSIVDDKIHNLNLMKKLNHFVEAICNNIFKMNGFKTAGKVAILSHLYKDLLRRGAHYLRQDSLQVLRSEMERNILQTDEDVEGRIF